MASRPAPNPRAIVSRYTVRRRILLPATRSYLRAARAQRRLVRRSFSDLRLQTLVTKKESATMQTPFSFMRRACILCLFVLFPALAAAAADPPNVILITLDTVRADRMGFLGSKLGLTPQLDALASQGVVFEHAYSQAPITPVSHATILTGTFPQYHGIRNFGDRLPPSVPFLPEILHAQGYRTGAFVGSIILDPKNGFASGFERGFDVYDAGFHRQKTGERREASMQRRGEVTLGYVLEWLGHRQKGPFFLWFHLWGAHDPYNPPEPFPSRFPNAPSARGI